jgi:hypothetical protein
MRAVIQAAIRQGSACFRGANSGAIGDDDNDRPWASTVVWAPIRAAEDLRDTP